MIKSKLITDCRALDDCIRSIKQSSWVAVDTEFLRETTYYPLLCLIQIRTESVGICIDALAIDDLSPLQAIFADKNITKILHASRQDLEALDQRMDTPICNLYDTQIAAALCGYGGQISYAGLVESICQVRLDKSHTRTDWAARPLSSAQLQYAIDDVNYLYRLQQALANQLSEFGRCAWHREECENTLKLENYRIDPQDVWQRLKGGAKIPIKYQHSAKALSIWREQKAQQRNRPREWILSTRALTEICKCQPSNLAQLAELKMVNANVVKFSGNAILNILNTASTGKTPVWHNYTPSDKAQRKQLSEIINKLKSIAEASHISQSMLANRHDIEAMIVGKVTIPLLEGWRYEFCGKEIVAEFIMDRNI